jgi:hypothetical protein
MSKYATTDIQRIYKDAYWQAAIITQPIFVGKNAVNKHLFTS